MLELLSEIWCDSYADCEGDQNYAGNQKKSLVGLALIKLYEFILSLIEFQALKISFEDSFFFVKSVFLQGIGKKGYVNGERLY